MFSTTARPAGLIDDGQIEAWVRATFGASEVDGVRVVVKVDGRAVGERTGGPALRASDPAMRAAIRELTQSFAMHGGSIAPGDTRVGAPPAATIRTALRALTDPEARRRALGAALSIFGRRVVAPLEALLTSRQASPAARLAMFREQLRAQVAALPLASETQRILRTDLDAMLTDEYLAMLADNEERTLRPRLTELARRVLDVLAGTFHRALDRFDANVDAVGDRVVRRIPPQMPLRDLPGALKRGFVDAVADYLTVETGSELRGALATLSRQYADVVPAGESLAFADEWYADLAVACWDVIAQFS